MTCPHTETFTCHDTERCSACLVDSYLLADGSRVFPSQDSPDRWDDERIARWFLDNKIYRLPPDCDGFTFCRDNKAGAAATYGYVWVEVVLDLDYQMAYMLDVRRHDGRDETRHFVFVGSGSGSAVERVTSHHHTPFRQDCLARLIAGLHWFAAQVEIFLDS